MAIESYPAFVLERLADSYDCDTDGVAEHIITSWAADHVEYLRQAGASLRDFRERSTPTPDPEGGEG